MNIKHLVISGGGPSMLQYISAIQYLNENYIYFILDYSIANESTKCKKIIKKFMNKKKDNIGLNESKKYVSKYTNGKIKH